MSKKNHTPSFGDPYELLGVEPGATDAVIAKAYRKLALQLHPDKQQDASPEEAERVSKLFHDVKEARAFLLDPEHAEEKRKYGMQRASERMRREEDARRESRMSQTRKEMREKLAKKEQSLKRKGKSSAETDQDLLERLKKEGLAKRERHAERAASEAAKQEAKERRARSTEREERQVRLKWSRRRMKTSPSEHSIATLFSKFGQVEHVEIIGAKGNEALVTFTDRSCCGPCVDFYAESDEMRAKFVGSRKQKEQELRRNRVPSPAPERTQRDRDGENLDDRKLRQAAERESLLRQMEMEDMGGATHDGPTAESQAKSFATEKDVSHSQKISKFPPPFPSDKDNQGLSPFQQLEKFEKAILEDIVSPDILKRMQITT